MKVFVTGGTRVLDQPVLRLLREKGLRLPWIVVRLVARDAALAMGRSQRVSNQRFKAATGWTPQVHDVGEAMRLVASG